MCDEVPPLLQADITSLAATLKASKLPEELVPKQTLETMSTFGRFADADEAKEPKRIKFDHGCESFLEQLSTTVVDAKRERYADGEKGTLGAVGFANVHAGQDSKVIS